VNGGSTVQAQARQKSIGVLRRFLATKPASTPGELCEMCATAIATQHSHVVDVDGRGLLCTCRACWLLFTQPGAAQGRYRAVPERYLHVPDFNLSESVWDEVQIPVRLAFFFRNSSMGCVVAFYPSPAGATQSELPVGVWDDLVRTNRVLSTLQDDVEALLVRGDKGQTGFECFVVPIDACYALTGVLRRRWKGFDGGEEAWRDIGHFFDRLRERSRRTSREEGS